MEVEISNPQKRPGQVSYELLVRLTKDAPVGTIDDQLYLVTNDPKNTDLPVSVEGRVVSDITLSPESMFLGVVQPGQQVQKTLVVRGKKPFRITKIECEDDSFQIKPPEQGPTGPQDPGDLHGRRSGRKSDADDLDRHRPGGRDGHVHRLCPSGQGQGRGAQGGPQIKSRGADQTPR